MEFSVVVRNRTLETWRLLASASMVAAMVLGGAVEWYLDKSHSLIISVLQFAVLGVIGCFTVIFAERTVKLNIAGGLRMLPVRVTGPSALFVLSWLFDYRHGLILSHQYAGIIACAAGSLIGLAWRVRQGSPIRLPSPVPAPKKRALQIKKAKKKRPQSTANLPRAIRNLAFAMNSGYRMSKKEQGYVEENLYAAVLGLVKIGRSDKAAQLLKHVLVTGATIAEQIYLLDDTFEAKLVALRLDPRLAHHIRSAARNASHAMKRVGAN